MTVEIGIFGPKYECITWAGKFVLNFLPDEVKQNGEHIKDGVYRYGSCIYNPIEDDQ